MCVCVFVRERERERERKEKYLVILQQTLARKFKECCRLLSKAKTLESPSASLHRGFCEARKFFFKKAKRPKNFKDAGVMFISLYLTHSITQSLSYFVLVSVRAKKVRKKILETFKNILFNKKKQNKEAKEQPHSTFLFRMNFYFTFMVK